MSKPYTNKQLALDYLKAAGASGSSRSYLMISRRIGKFQPSIADWYREHGNIDGLNLCGVGPKTQPILGQLLSDVSTQDLAQQRV